MYPRLSGFLSGFLMVWSAAALPPSPGTAAVQSQSGQFVIGRAGPASPNPVTAALATNQLYLELEPALLVVSCERIRQALCRTLGLTPPWQGRIHITLFPARGADDAVTLTAERFQDNWQYRLQVPDVVDRRRLMRALVEALLVETANHHATGRSAELPPWLAIGLAEQLLASAEVELLFPPPRQKVGGLTLSRTVVTSRRRDPLANARDLLTEAAPRTLQELSWPTERDFTGETAAAYWASAQLFVTGLLQLDNGPACLRAFLHELPRHLNWQNAFLRSYPEHFGRLLDVEKWWTLQLVHFTGRDLANAWPPADSWHKLDAAVHVPTRVRTAPDALPSAGTVALQVVVAEWDSARQTPALRHAVHQLELIRQRVTPGLFALAEDYRQVLAGYLEQRDKLGVVPSLRRSVRPQMARLIEDTVRRLDTLDARLEAARPNEPATKAATETP